MLDGKQLIGTGRTCEVFAWEQDRVLKLLLPEAPQEWADIEAGIGHDVQAAGLPVPFHGEILELAGRRGFIQERMGGMLLGQRHAKYKKDVMVEVQAALGHESRDSLGRIQVPVLIICGTVNVYFPKQYVEEMASLVKGSSLKLYEGKGHMGALEDEAFSRDIFEFIGRTRS